MSPRRYAWLLVAMLWVVALLNYLDLTRGSFTGIASRRGDETVLIGQMIYTPGERSAQISFLLPGDNLDQPSLPDLIESLAVQAGSWCAANLLVISTLLLSGGRAGTYLAVQPRSMVSAA